MNLFKLALKNILRHKKRSFLTISMVFVGVFLTIFSYSFEMGLIQESFKNLQNFETGYAQVLDERYFKKRKKNLIKYTYNPASVIEKLKKTDYKWTTRTLFQTEAIVYEDPYPQDASLYLKAVAVDPKRDGQVYHMKDYIKEGSFIKKSTTNGVVIGENLANKLGAKLGYEMMFSMKTKNKMEQALDVKIIGIYNTPNPSVNRDMVFFSKKYINDSLYLNNYVTNISFKLDELREKSEYSELSATLKDVLKGTPLHLYKWSEIESSVVEITQGDMGGIYFMAFFLFLITFIGISNTTLMSVNERYFEIGMLRSMGMSSLQILRLFSYEGFLIGFFGGLIALIFVIPVNYYMVNTGVDVSFMLGEDVNMVYRVMGVLKSSWSVDAMVVTVIFGFVISTIAAYFSARRAVKKEIIDCLKETP